LAVITGYTSLQGAVADYLARADLVTGGWIPNFIQNFEERFYRDSENWGSWMESNLSVTVTANVAAVPADHMGLRIAYFAGYPPLNRLSLEQLYSRYPRGASTSGGPRAIARNRTNFEFGPENTSGTLLGTYYAKPVLLRSFASDAAAHFLIVNAPDLLLYGALLEAEPFIKEDARAQIWMAAKQVALDAYRARFVREDDSGSAPFTVAM
jgi:hypothetical protein